MLRTVTVVITIAALAGCVTAPRHRTAAYVTGGAITAFGAGLVYAGATADCRDPSTAIDCGLAKGFAPVWGGVAIAAGLAIIGITAFGVPPATSAQAVRPRHDAGPLSAALAE